MESVKDYRLYILMRNDLQSMSPGRAMAQASHASNAFVIKFSYGINVKDWQRQTNQGFGTVIVLSSDLLTIKKLFTGPLRRHIIKDYVIDPEYGVTTSGELFELIPKNKYISWVSNNDNSVTFFRKVVTCAYVFGNKEELTPSLGGLPLHP